MGNWSENQCLLTVRFLVLERDKNNHHLFLLPGRPAKPERLGAAASSQSVGCA
jgi:hypothetical protein